MKRKNGRFGVINFVLSLVFLMASFVVPARAQQIGVKTDTGIKKEGVTVRPDNNSPTGYTATFVYKNSTATKVEFYGQFTFARTGQDYPNTSVTSYTPYQWTKDMFPLTSAVYQEAMTKVKGTDFWTISMPLPSGGYPYSYVVDGTKVADPANMPITNVNGGKQTLSMAYIPFDKQKQVTDYSYVLPKEGAKTGKVSFVKYSTKGLLTTDLQPLGIYLPFGYDANRTEPYKVIYLSHGGGGNESDWFNTGSAANIMDNLIAEKKTEPAIVVTMDNSAFGWNFVNINKNMMENIIPYMESHYNVSKNVKDRAFAGLSMGALTASNLYYAHPTDFGYFGIFSGANAALDLTKNTDALRTPKLFVGAGCYDMAYYNLGFNSDKYTLKFLEMLDANSIPYQFQLANGAHDWFTWPQLFDTFAKNIVWK
ncbi:alpha/beta hydrolase-fold protein [Clostridium fungisolvens]|uniref:Esterase n=1 Tax=Clostridium fungisolvens TaxID=1604897 RepID=A0A6V8SIL1_9CLOT|nr:alpha/beta hydrolase-fold protein [Clostridium fungisolvens]GFP74713.1 hypothetical protein bsdtw1_00768 [Clostridium fungisolvens]